MAVQTLLVSRDACNYPVSQVTSTDITCRMVPLGILLIVIAVLFEVYKTDFERWARPLTDWLRARESWSWVLPVVILIVLSFPPLFGHEIVQLIVGVGGPNLDLLPDMDVLTRLIADLSSRCRTRHCLCGRHSGRSCMFVSSYPGCYFFLWLTSRQHRIQVWIHLVG